MSRLHRIVPTVAAGLATAALLAPTAQARPAVSGSVSGGGNAPAVERTVHDQPLANPVAVPSAGLNHGGGLAVGDSRTPGTGTEWVGVFGVAAASALVIAACAAGVGVTRRANTAT